MPAIGPQFAAKDLERAELPPPPEEDSQFDVLLRPGLLADAVAPISYAVKGTAFAAGLWRYKSWRSQDPATRASLLALLLTFLHDHDRCVWRHAGMPAPGRLAVVPTGCGRPGPHPLLAMAGPYLRLPRTGLVIRPGEQGRRTNRETTKPLRTGKDRKAGKRAV